jgi:hypothetical protein
MERFRYKFCRCYRRTRPHKITPGAQQSPAFLGRETDNTFSSHSFFLFIFALIANHLPPPPPPAAPATRQSAC